MPVADTISSDRQQIEARVRQINWCHPIDLGGGLVTRPERHIQQRFARRLRLLSLPDDLTGKSVLDIGAWDGYFSFECERRGASRIVAIDTYAWDVHGKDGFLLAKSVLGSKVESMRLAAEDLDPAVVGEFDLVLFLGVLYHLRHPLLALERVASVARELLILETVVDMVGIRRPAMAFYPDRELSNDPTNWWGPNVPAVGAMLRSVGFGRVRQVTPLPPLPRRAARAVSHRLRGKNSLRAAFRQDRAAFHAWKTPTP